MYYISEDSEIWYMDARGSHKPKYIIILGEVKRGLQRTKSASESPKIREFQTLVTPCEKLCLLFRHYLPRLPTEFHRQ